MASAAAKKLYTPAEYLALERRAEVKSEYVDGIMVAMAGASRAHVLITGNLAREIGIQLKNRSCETYSSDMRVLVTRTGLYTYPDLVVVCGEPQFEDSAVDTLLNPTVIIEVLSRATESSDRGKKYGHYRRLESLREYVLVAQDEVRVERFSRHGDLWQITDVTSIDETLDLTSVNCQVPFRETYAKINFLTPRSAEPNS
jgi:Uma2 family endonuclease